MKGLDIFIVRLLPFILFIIFGIYLTCPWKGIDVRVFYYLHTNSLLYSFSLFLISLANNKYHCIWNRTMYMFLILMPIMNFVDSVCGIYQEPIEYLIAVSILFVITAIITAFLAIRHFIQLSIKRHNNGNDQY